MRPRHTLYTLVSAAARQRVDAALARDDSAVHGATSDEQRATIIHASELTALYAQYDYGARSCLIVDVTHAVELLASPPVQTLLGLVAGFDCAVLLT